MRGRSAISMISLATVTLIAGCNRAGNHDSAGQYVVSASRTPQRTGCIDVTSYDYNWNNDMLCTRPDGSTFYTSYAGAAQYEQSLTTKATTATESFPQPVLSPSSYVPPVPQGAPSVPPGVAGTWTGSYDCAQGATGLKLIVGVDGRATFSFSPLPANPSVPPGEFEMQVRMDGHSLRFSQVAWIQRPGQYLMVDLVVNARSSKAMSGNVIGNGCTTFQVTRT